MNSTPQVYPSSVLGSAQGQQATKAPAQTVRDSLLASIEQNKEAAKLLEKLAETLTPEQQAMPMEQFRALVYRFV